MQSVFMCHFWHINEELTAVYFFFIQGFRTYFTRVLNNILHFVVLELKKMSVKLTYIFLEKIISAFSFFSRFFFSYSVFSCSLLFCFGVCTNLALNLELHPANLYSYEILLVIFLICNLLWIKLMNVKQKTWLSGCTDNKNVCRICDQNVFIQK